MNKSLRDLIILLAVFAVVFGIRIFWFTQKDGFHVDEGMTIALACYKSHIVQRNYEYDREYTGKEIKDISFTGNETFLDTFKDIKSLYTDNRDPPHTNLYYTLLRISFIGINSADIKPIIFRGAVLNLILFTISFFFLFLLMRLLFPDSILLQYSALLCAFLSTAAISNTMFLRPYQIQETMFIVLCYFFIKTIDLKNNLLNDKKRFLNNQIFLFALIMGITLLTGYYAVIFIGLLGLYVIYVKCREKRYSDLLFYVPVLILGLFTAFVLYPKYFEGFSSYRGTETIKTISGNIFYNLKISMNTALSLLYNNFFSLWIIVLCILCTGYLVYKKQKLIMPKHSLFIFIAAVLYFIITLIIAPYKVLRYGMPVYPFFVIFPLLLINSISCKPCILQQSLRQKIAAIAAVLLCLCFLIGTFNKNKIENLFLDKQEQYAFTQDTQTPVYIFMFYFRDWDYVATWKYGNLVPYLNNEQKYYFIDDYEDLYSLPFDEFYLVVENVPHLRRFTNTGFEVLDRYEIVTGEPETPSGTGEYFFCMKVRRK